MLYSNLKLGIVYSHFPQFLSLQNAINPKSRSMKTGNPKIIDSHAHVVSEYFQDETDEVIKRAFDSNVVQLVNPGVVTKNIPELLEIAEKYEQISVGVGIHPHDAKDWSDKEEQKIVDAASHKKVVAIGECGLDFYYNNSERDAQLHAFRQQIKIAKSLDKPVIVHCRDAWQEALDILESEHEGGKLKGVFHCFTGGPDLIPRISALDFYVSFSGIVTYKNAKEIQEAAKVVASDRFLVETDCPFLAPQKVRGKRNEPSYVWMVAEKLADLRGVELDDIAGRATDNARALFKLPVI